MSHKTIKIAGYAKDGTLLELEEMHFDDNIFYDLDVDDKEDELLRRLNFIKLKDDYKERLIEKIESLRKKEFDTGPSINTHHADGINEAFTEIIYLIENW